MNSLESYFERAKQEASENILWRYENLTFDSWVSMQYKKFHRKITLENVKLGFNHQEFSDWIRKPIIFKTIQQEFNSWGNHNFTWDHFPIITPIKEWNKHNSVLELDHLMVSNRWMSLLERNHNRSENSSGDRVCVDQFDIEGNFIKKWSSMSQASRALNIKKSDQIKLVCEGKLKTAGGFSWKYSKIDSFVEEMF